MIFHYCLSHGDPGDIISVGGSAESAAFDDEGVPDCVLVVSPDSQGILLNHCLPATDVVAFNARDFATLASGRCLLASSVGPAPCYLGLKQWRLEG